MTTVAIPELASLTDEEIGQLWHASGGALDLAELEAEFARREQAEKREQARKLAQMRWHDAAHAQFEQAEKDCRGVLLSAYGIAHGPADAFGLWSGEWREVKRYASEELLLWFAEHPRLTFQAWQRQGSQAANARRARDERDQAAEPAAPRLTVAPMQPGSIARYAAALEYMTRQAETVTARLVASHARLLRSA